MVKFTTVIFALKSQNRDKLKFGGCYEQKNRRNFKRDRAFDGGWCRRVYNDCRQYEKDPQKVQEERHPRAWCREGYDRRSRVYDALNIGIGD